MRYSADDLLDVADREAGIEKHLAQKHQVVPAARGGMGKALSEVLERLGRDLRDRHQPVFLKPRDLARETHELRSRRQHAYGALRQAGQDADQKRMRVRSKSDGGGIG